MGDDFLDEFIHGKTPEPPVQSRQVMPPAPVRLGAPTMPPASAPLVPVPPSVPALSAGIRGGLLGGIKLRPARLGLKPPRLQIVHKKERRDQLSEPGQMMLGRLVFDEAIVVFLLAHDGRQMKMGTGKQTHTVCASIDNEQPLADITPFSEYCQPCAYSQWRSENGKRKPPPCSTFVSLLGVLMEATRLQTTGDPGGTLPGDFRPFWMIGSKTAEQPFLQLLGTMQKQVEEGAEHLAQFRVRITTEPNPGEGFTWYTPKFEVLEMLPPDTYRAMKEQAETAELRWMPTVRLEETDKPGSEQPGAEGGPADDEDIPF